MAKVLKKKSVYRQSGYLCGVCGAVSLSYNGEVLDRCPSCDEVGQLKLQWDHKINEQIEIEDLLDVGPAEV